MTEDDTFDRLRRPQIKEMIDLWRKSPIPSWTSEDALAFFKSHGWDRDKFLKAWVEYNGRAHRD